MTHVTERIRHAREKKAIGAAKGRQLFQVNQFRNWFVPVFLRYISYQYK